MKLNPPDFTDLLSGDVRQACDKLAKQAVYVRRLKAHASTKQADGPAATMDAALSSGLIGGGLGAVGGAALGGLSAFRRPANKRNILRSMLLGGVTGGLGGAGLNAAAQVGFGAGVENLPDKLKEMQKSPKGVLPADPEDQAALARYEKGKEQAGWPAVRIPFIDKVLNFVSDGSDSTSTAMAPASSYPSGLRGLPARAIGAAVGLPNLGSLVGGLGSFGMDAATGIIGAGQLGRFARGQKGWEYAASPYLRDGAGALENTARRIFQGTPRLFSRLADLNIFSGRNASIGDEVKKVMDAIRVSNADATTTATDVYKRVFGDQIKGGPKGAPPSYQDEWIKLRGDLVKAQREAASLSSVSNPSPEDAKKLADLVGDPRTSGGRIGGKIGDLLDRMDSLRDTMLPGRLYGTTRGPDGSNVVLSNHRTVGDLLDNNRFWQSTTPGGQPFATAREAFDARAAGPSLFDFGSLLPGERFNNKDVINLADSIAARDFKTYGDTPELFKTVQVPDSSGGTRTISIPELTNYLSNAKGAPTAPASEMAPSNINAIRSHSAGGGSAGDYQRRVASILANEAHRVNAAKPLTAASTARKAISKGPMLALALPILDWFSRFRRPEDALQPGDAERLRRLAAARAAAAAANMQPGGAKP